MKRNAIIRIVLFSILALTLIVVLLGGIAFHAYGNHQTVIHEESDAPVVHDFTFSPRDIDTLKINWVSGTIHIEATDTDEISVNESASVSQKPMVLKQSGSTLYVEFCEDASGFSMNFGSSTHKDLYITVPRDWDFKKVKLDGASADVEVIQLSGKEFDIETASGNNTFRDCFLQELELDSASGDLNYSGIIEDKVKMSTASGKANLVLKAPPKAIKIDSVSGDLNLTLPENSGFTLEKSTVSGAFSSEFATVIEDGKTVCGDGACKIEVNGVSSSVTIKKS